MNVSFWNTFARPWTAGAGSKAVRIQKRRLAAPFTTDRKIDPLEQFGVAAALVGGDAAERGHAQFVQRQAGPDFVIDAVGGGGRQQGELAHGKRHIVAALLDAIL